MRKDNYEMPAVQPSAREKPLWIFLRKVRNPFSTMVDVIYKGIGGEWCGSVCVPLDGNKIKVNEVVVAFTNDAFDIHIGWSDNWAIGLDRNQFLKVCLWYLYQRSFVEWFGLRRKIWYWALHQKCKRYK